MTANPYDLGANRTHDLRFRKATNAPLTTTDRERVGATQDASERPTSQPAHNGIPGELAARSGFTVNAIKTDLLAGFTSEQVEKIRARFEAKVSPCPLTGCYHWDAAVTKEGYGVFALTPPGTKKPGSKTRRIVFAHRLAYELAHGPIAPGLTVDHTRVCKCVNPAHMEPVSNRVNIDRRTLRRRLAKITFAQVFTALTATALAEAAQ